jgi:hypothetical protein
LRYNGCLEAYNIRLYKQLLKPQVLIKNWMDRLMKSEPSSWSWDQGVAKGAAGEA